jgi:hypothetical protein
MVEYSILRCSKCGEPAIYAPTVATTCRSCNKKLDRTRCYFLAHCEDAKAASFMLRRIKEALARARLGG